MLLGPQAVQYGRAEQIRREIADIIRDQRFHAVFEPVLDLVTREVVGYEALTRFDDDVAPDRRFGDAHLVGVGGELEAACATAALIAAESLPAGVWVAVNFSPSTLVEGRAAAVVAGTSRPVVIEITEHTAIENYAAVRRAIELCGDVRVAVDDAGAGFASLRHILELRPDIIKLDLALVRDIDTDPAETGARSRSPTLRRAHRHDAHRRRGRDRGPGRDHSTVGCASRAGIPVPAHRMSWTERWLRAEADERPRLLVVGGASLDIIHVRGVPVATPGGAGCTPRSPPPAPVPTSRCWRRCRTRCRPSWRRRFARLRWVGPTVPLDGLPRFEIAYDDEGAVTLFREHLGAEPDMTPALLDGLGGSAWLRVLRAVPRCHAPAVVRQRPAASGMPHRGFHLRQGRRARRPTSCGARRRWPTCSSATPTRPMCCSAASTAAAPSPGSFRFVTRGATGAAVYPGRSPHRCAPRWPPIALDPTGAGDTFCGTTIARILAGDHPVEAARRGNAAAAEMVAAVGPAALWTHGALAGARRPTRDVVVDHARSVGSPHCCAPCPVSRPSISSATCSRQWGIRPTVEWFAAATLQQYGFWYEVDGGYGGPMIATIDGVRAKGQRLPVGAVPALASPAAGVLAPARQATLGAPEWQAGAIADDGVDPYPDPVIRLALARSYGSTMGSIGVSAADLVRPPRPRRVRCERCCDCSTTSAGTARIRCARRPRCSASSCASARSGYCPSLPTTAPRTTMHHPSSTITSNARACARGWSWCTSGSCSDLLERRRSLPAEAEDAVRRATFAAVALLAEHSGRGMGTVDWFLFQMRHRCPEMTLPQCAECPADPVCTKSTGLFQPVFRTTAY